MKRKKVLSVKFTKKEIKNLENEYERYRNYRKDYMAELNSEEIFDRLKEGFSLIMHLREEISSVPYVFHIADSTNKVVEVGLDEFIEGLSTAKTYLSTKEMKKGFSLKDAGFSFSEKVKSNGIVQDDITQKFNKVLENLKTEKDNKLERNEIFELIYYGDIKNDTKDAINVMIKKHSKFKKSKYKSLVTSGSLSSLPFYVSGDTLIQRDGQYIMVQNKLDSGVISYATIFNALGGLAEVFKGDTVDVDKIIDMYTFKSVSEDISDMSIVKVNELVEKNIYNFFS